MTDQPTPDELELMRKLTAQKEARKTRIGIGGDRTQYGRGISEPSETKELTFDCLRCKKPIIVPQPTQQKIANAIGVGGAGVELVKEERPIMLSCPSCKSEWGIDIRRGKDILHDKKTT